MIRTIHIPGLGLAQGPVVAINLDGTVTVEASGVRLTGRPVQSLRRKTEFRARCPDTGAGGPLPGMKPAPVGTATARVLPALPASARQLPPGDEAPPEALSGKRKTRRD